MPMRSFLTRALLLVAVTAVPAFASDGEAPKGLLSPTGGLMF